MNVNIRMTAAVLFSTVVTLAGCGGAKPDYPDTAAVTVTVTQAGQPLEGATVSFINPGSEYTGSGMSDASGNVVVTSFEQGDGLVPGEYKVTVRKSETISTPDPKDPAAPALSEKTVWHVAEKYSSVSSTPFEAAVAADGDNSFAFDVEK